MSNIKQSIMKKITFILAALATTLSFGQTNLFTDGTISTTTTLSDRADYVAPDSGNLGVWYENHHQDGAAPTIVDKAVKYVAQAKTVGIGQNVNISEEGIYELKVKISTSADAEVSTKKIAFLFFKDNVTVTTNKMQCFVTDDLANFDAASYQAPIPAKGTSKTYTRNLRFEASEVGYVGFKLNLGNGLLTAGSITFDDFSLVHVPNSNLSNDNNAVSGLNIYPNPVSDKLFVSATDIVEAVSLVNALGQSISAPYNGSTVDVSKLPKGVYILTVFADGKSSAKKIVVE